MNLTAILILLFSITASATGFSQNKINLQVKKSAIADAISKIEEQTSYRFLYNQNLGEIHQKVSAKLEDASIDEALLELLKNSGLSYQFINSDLIAIQKIGLAQADITVSGKVTDKSGDALIGVSVKIKGTTKGVSTDVNGQFSISAPESSTLVFSYLGYETFEQKISGQTRINIVLNQATSQLNEVVVVGYGAVKKRDLTGSVVSVKGEEVTKVPTTSVMESIQGKVPGVDITRSSGAAGAGVNVTIRGNRSIKAGNGPLYIVDGIQGVDIADISPNDIQSIDILKDASSTAIYGSRGANGVIIITTKRGSGDKPKFTFSSYAGVSQVAGYPEVMDGPAFVELKREAYRAANPTATSLNENAIFSAVEQAAIQNGVYTNYPDLLINDGLQQDYQLGVAGGSDKTKIYFSGNYFNEKGLFKLDGYKRYTGRLNIDQTINSWLKAGVQTQISYIDRNVRRDPLNQGNKIIPIGSAYNADGTLALYPNGGPQINPLVDEESGVYINKMSATRSLISGYLELIPIRDLSIRSVFAANLNNSETNYYAAQNTIDRATSTGALTNISPSNGKNLSWENIITYNKKINEHTITLTGVTSYLTNTQTFSQSQGERQLFGAQVQYGLGGGLTNLLVNSGYANSNLLSFTGRLNYNWKGKYLLTVTGRSDGSSKLSEGNKWGFFPSSAVGWRISDENFMKKQNLFSDLKFRASYGVSGNDAVDPYATQSALTRYPFTWDDNSVAVAYTVASRVGNLDLKWELTSTIDFGFDMGFLNNKISATVDYYDSKTKDLLLERELPFSTGAASVIQNVGKTRNRGFELGLTSNNISTKNFTWSTGLSFFTNKEEIVELAYGKSDDVGNRWFIGQPVNVFYDYEKIGIWQTNEAAEAKAFNAAYLPGDIKVKDQNGDGKFTESGDRIVIGGSVPKWSGGLNNDIKFKGFDFNLYLFARVGQWINSQYDGRYHPQGIENSSNINYWTPENPGGTFPRPNLNKSPASTPFISTLPYREASFLKIRNISLGYTVPTKLLSKAKIQNLRIYVTGKNLATFSNIKEFDPENNGSLATPLTRLYVAGINLGF